VIVVVYAAGIAAMYFGGSLAIRGRAGLFLLLFNAGAVCMAVPIIVLTPNDEMEPGPLLWRTLPFALPAVAALVVGVVRAQRAIVADAASRKES
jgi:hypothetical protein